MWSAFSPTRSKNTSSFRKNVGDWMQNELYASQDRVNAMYWESLDDFQQSKLLRYVTVSSLPCRSMGKIISE